MSKQIKMGGGGAKPTKKSLRLVSLYFCGGFIDVALKSIVGNPCTVNLFLQAFDMAYQIFVN